ncbi:hypothetical protein BKA70DRAFT_1563018 [Coprinopsis sp. MPI-PUGE-AT-0042]|nr:hypothetical protein BKA70DRAFT_1563018 [Coprinopsis sp. MPI-PUGE-AT-0042]
MASESLPPSDQEMNTYGGMLAASIFGTSVLSASLLVVQIVLVLYGFSGFLATPEERRKGRLRFIIISSLMVVFCTIDIIFDLWKNFLILFTGGPEGVSYLKAFGVLDITENWRWDPIGDAFFFTAIAFGDILMLWRCSILWSDKRWVVLFPFLACLGSIASNITSIVADIVSDDGLSNKVLISGAVSNVAMNIMITSLIVFRVLQARYRTAKAFPNREPPRWYSEVMALVVESAAPLAIFGILFIALSGTILSESSRQLQSGHVLQRAGHNVATDVVKSIYDAFCTLSPQMIIVRVTRGKAWNSSGAEGTEKGGNFSQPIQFAHSARDTASNSSDSI